LLSSLLRLLLASVGVLIVLRFLKISIIFLSCVFGTNH
jgi:hypothetical protein